MKCEIKCGKRIRLKLNVLSEYITEWAFHGKCVDNGKKLCKQKCDCECMNPDKRYRFLNIFRKSNNGYAKLLYLTAIMKSKQ